MYEIGDTVYRKGIECTITDIDNGLFYIKAVDRNNKYWDGWANTNQIN